MWLLDIEQISIGILNLNPILSHISCVTSLRLSIRTYKMKTVVSASLSLWALSDVMYTKVLAQSLTQSAAWNMPASTIITIMIINNFYLEQWSSNYSETLLKFTNRQ